MIYVAEWFLAVPLSLRPPGRLARHDQGRKAYLDPAKAEDHYRELVAVADQALAEAGEDHWERQTCAVQRVELYAVALPGPLTQATLQAAIDDTWGTPHHRHPDPYPWRRDQARQPWLLSRRVLLHWRPSTEAPTCT